MIPPADTVRIFPLAEVVLFPDTLLPLHIFEQRYRKMLADALEDDHIIGMVLVRGGRLGDESNVAEVYPTGCAGEVVKHEVLPDGRSIIVLKGTVKFRIRSEPPNQEPYRIAKTQALHEAPPPAEFMRAWRDDLRLRLTRYVTALSGDVRSIERLFGKIEIERLVNYLSASLPLDVLEKQTLLECPSVEARCQRLCEILDFKVAEADLGMDSTRDLDG